MAHVDFARHILLKQLVRYGCHAERAESGGDSLIIDGVQCVARYFSSQEQLKSFLDGRPAGPVFINEEVEQGYEPDNGVFVVRGLNATTFSAFVVSEQDRGFDCDTAEIELPILVKPMPKAIVDLVLRQAAGATASLAVGLIERAVPVGPIFGPALRSAAGQGARESVDAMTNAELQKWLPMHAVALEALTNRLLQVLRWRRTRLLSLSVGASEYLSVRIEHEVDEVQRHIENLGALTKEGIEWRSADTILNKWMLGAKMHPCTFFEALSHLNAIRAAKPQLKTKLSEQIDAASRAVTDWVKK